LVERGDFDTNAGMFEVTSHHRTSRPRIFTDEDGLAVCSSTTTREMRASVWSRR
jgi:hypothetical protein